MPTVQTPLDIGLVIRERRRALGLRQAELADRIRTSRQWIIALEKGKPGIELGLVLRALRALDLTAEISPQAAEPPTSGIDIDAVLAGLREPRS